MNRTIVISAGILLTTLGLASPAQAAVPTTKPTDVVHCGKKAALVWEERRWVEHRVGGVSYDESTFTRLAAVNPCKEWLEISWGDSDPRERRHDWSSLFLAPGQKFNWNESQIKKYGADTPGGYVGYVELVATKQVCAPSSYAFAKKVYKYNDVRSVGDCRGADPKASHTVQKGCVDGGRATLTWKMDGKKITKLAVDSSCRDDLPMYAVVWWRYKYGTAALFTGGGANSTDGEQAVDLWKSELDDMPRDTIDGKVHFVTDWDDDDAFTFTWTAGQHGVGCWGGDGACEWRR